MLRKLIMALGAFLLFLLQCCVFPHFNMGGIVPNLILLITSIYGFMHGDKAGMITGFCLGLLFDIFFGQAIGLHAIILTYIGYLNGRFCGIYYTDDLKLPLGLILTSNFSYSIACYITSFLIRGNLSFGYYFTHIVLPEVFYTMLVTIVVYPVVLVIYNAFERQNAKNKKEA